MKNEQQKLTLFQKLLKIQKEVKGLAKDKQSHNYQYVTGNKLLSFVKPLMDELGLLLKQEIISIDNERQDYHVWDKWAENSNGKKGDWKPKSEILSKVMMRFTWIDTDTGEKDENLFGANGQNDWEKGLGSALTYAERYFILKYFHIATDEDDIDNPERKNKLEKEDVAKPKNQNNGLPWLNLFDKQNNPTEQLKALEAFFKDGKKTTIATLRKKYNVSAATEKQLKEKFNIQ